MDTSVDDSSKRAASAGMEVSFVERMMQEDFVWSVNDVSDMCEETSKDVQRAVTDMNFYDETTGELFNQRLVREAEDEELQRFKGVYDYVVRQTAHQNGEGVFVKVGWVREQGYEDPHMKCRLVAQELGYGTRMDQLYANTPSQQQFTVRPLPIQQNSMKNGYYENNGYGKVLREQVCDELQHHHKQQLEQHAQQAAHNAQQVHQ